jgi:hypothetical protein
MSKVWANLDLLPSTNQIQNVCDAVTQDCMAKACRKFLTEGLQPTGVSYYYDCLNKCWHNTFWQTGDAQGRL